MPQLAQRLRFDLADAFPRHAELPADLLQGAGPTVVESEAELEHLALARRERLQHVLQLLLEHGERRRFRWSQGVLILDEVPQVAVLLFADGPVIQVQDLPEPLRTGGPAPATAETPHGGETGLKDIVRMKAAELEKDLIAKALEETGGNVTRAAKLLQISRKSLQTKMKEFSLRELGADKEEPEE